MGLITTMGRFSYIQCDARNCTRKIERSGANQLRELAALCGWEFRDDQWLCPSCAQKSRPKTKAKKPSKGKQKAQAAR